MVICLFVHPVLLEAGEAASRSNKGDTIARRLRTGDIKTFEEAAARIVECSLMDSLFKLIMAFYRRFMLLGMGNVQATMFAVVAASIEETGSRGFLVEIDTRLRQLRDKPPLQGDELQLQRYLWMCDSNQPVLSDEFILQNPYLFLIDYNVVMLV